LSDKLSDKLRKSEIRKLLATKKLRRHRKKVVSCEKDRKKKKIIVATKARRFEVGRSKDFWPRMNTNDHE